MRSLARCWLIAALLASSQAVVLVREVAAQEPEVVEAPPTLLGDWAGLRTDMLNQGMLWNVDQAMFYYGVGAGGRDRQFTFAGHGDFLLNWDLSKVGLQEGLFLKVRAEHRYGNSISGATGAILPATIAADLPVFDRQSLYLSNVLFTQMLSPTMGVFMGKADTLDGDLNAFAHRRGLDQFSNLGFVANPLLLRSVPYSTLMAGFAVLGENQEPTFTFAVLNATDTTRTSGIGELFAHGATLNAELRRPFEIDGLAGHVLLGGAWSSRHYVALGQDPRVVLPTVPFAQQAGTWALYGNFDQYLVSYDDSGRGWGVFGRASIADNQANPFAYFFSAGIGGDSPIQGREQDSFGVGYYYLATSDQIGILLQAALGGPVGDGHGVELFYNYAIAPSTRLTADLQILTPEVKTLDTSIVAGLRLKIDF